MSLVKKQKVSEDKLVVQSSSVLTSSAVVLEGHEGPVYCAKFNSTGDFIASGGADKTISVWRLPVDGNEEVHVGQVQAHKSGITSLQWTEDGLISASGDRTLAVWDLSQGTKTRTLKNNSIINEVSYNGTLAISGDDSGLVKIWDLRTKHAVNTIATKFPVLTVDSFADNKIFFAGIDPTINCYDIRNLEKPSWTTPSSIDSITSLSVNGDGTQLVSRSVRGAVSTHNARDIIPPNSKRSSPYIYDGAPSSGNEYKLIRACFSNNGANIVSGSDDKSVTIWDVTTRRILNKCHGHEGSVLDVDYHPLMKIIVSTSLDGTLIVREV